VALQQVLTPNRHQVKYHYRVGAETGQVVSVSRSVAEAQGSTAQVAARAVRIRRRAFRTDAIMNHDEKDQE
jgi:hypothetical protein